MNEQGILNALIEEFPELINKSYPFPSPFDSGRKIKAIILGADPTHIVNGEPMSLEMVFGLEKPNSPYWRSIMRNLAEVNLSMDNLFVQNLCRNYFMKETSENEIWSTVARNYWAPLLRKELNEKYSCEIPILMTTEFVLHSILIVPKRKIKAKTIYEEKIVIPKDENLLGRELIAFYRHYKYSLALPEWKKYKGFINNRFSSEV